MMHLYSFSNTFNFTTQMEAFGYLVPNITGWFSAKVPDAFGRFGRLDSCGIFEQKHKLRESLKVLLRKLHNEEFSIYVRY